MTRSLKPPTSEAAFPMSSLSSDKLDILARFGAAVDQYSQYEDEDNLAVKDSEMLDEIYALLQDIEKNTRKKKGAGVGKRSE